MVKHLMMVVIGILAGSISGISAERVYHSYFEPKAPQIAVIDLKKLVVEHQNGMIKKYPGQLSEQGKKDVQNNAQEFAAKLSSAIEALNKDHILIVKDAVIGESQDLTDQVRRMVDGNAVSK